MIEDVEKHIIELINILNEIGVISKHRIAEAISVEDVLIVKESSRYNYRELSKELIDRPIFIVMDRKRAMYAKKRFEELIGKRVVKRKATYGSLDGYLFMTFDYANA